MATATAAAKGVKDFVFEWEGKDRNGKIVKGELRAGGEAMVSATLRRLAYRPPARRSSVVRHRQCMATRLSRPATGKNSNYRLN